MSRELRLTLEHLDKGILLIETGREFINDVHLDVQHDNDTVLHNLLVEVTSDFELLMCKLRRVKYLTANLKDD